MENKKIRWQLPFLLLLIIGTVFIIRRHSNPPYQNNKGRIFGTVYNITYQSDEDLQGEIEAVLHKVDGALSPFNDTSIITRINRNEEVVPDSFFIRVFDLAKIVSEDTNGAFDITVAPLANAWGFGFKTGTGVDSLTIDSLRQYVGFEKIWKEKGKIVKADEGVMLSCSSIAKGYGSDVVAGLFDRKGIRNYMVEIGGEIVVKGKNRNNDWWRIGVNKPIDDSLALHQALQTVLNISDKGMATSGNYRNFYYKDGKKYAHTIDPRTGYPVQHNILSATVVAKDCATADAYATAFMVMGLDSAKLLCNRHPELDAYFIYSDENGNMATCFTEGMKAYLQKKRLKKKMETEAERIGERLNRI